MAPNARDALDQLRAVLRVSGYGELVEDEAAEAEVLDRSASSSVRQLVGALEEGVVPAMRATAEASLLLGERQAVEKADRPPVNEPPSVDPTAVRLTLGASEAERLAGEANELQRLLDELRRSVDVDDK